MKNHLFQQSNPSLPHWARQICISTCSCVDFIFYYIDLLVSLCQQFSALIIITSLPVLLSGKAICYSFPRCSNQTFPLSDELKNHLWHSKNSDVSVCLCMRVCICFCVCTSVCVHTCMCVYVYIALSTEGTWEQRQNGSTRHV